MKDNNNIDDIFRSGLEEFKITPSEKTWNSLDAALDKKQAGRKRKNRLKLLSLALLLLLFSYPTYKFLTGDQSSSQNNRDQINASEEIKNTSTPPIEKNLKSSEENKEEPASISDRIKNALGENSEPSNKIAREKFSEQSLINNIPVTTAVVKSNNNSSIQTQQEVSKTATVAVEEKTLTGTEVSEEKNKLKEETGSAEINNVILVNDPITPADVRSEKYVNEQVHTNNKTLTDNAVNETPVDNKDRKVLLENVQEENNSDKNELKNTKTESTENITNSSNLITDNTENTVAQNSDDSKSVFKKIASNLSFGIFYSPDLVNNRLKINDSYTGTASRNIDDYNNQKAAFSYSTGFNLRYDIGSRWNIGSGITYSTFAQTAVYNIINVVSDSVYREVHGHHYSGGPGGHGGGGHGGGHGGGQGGSHGGNNPHNPPQGGNGNHYVVQTPSGAIDLYNKPPHPNGRPNQHGDTLDIKTTTSESIQFFNIPLSVRYKFIKTRFTYFLEVGGTMNFVKGSLVKINVNDSYTENNEHDGLKKTSYSLLLGAGVQYNFYKGLSLSLNPAFRYTITPINQNNPMNSYPYYIGIGAGLSIHF